MYLVVWCLGYYSLSKKDHNAWLRPQGRGRSSRALLKGLGTLQHYGQAWFQHCYLGGLKSAHSYGGVGGGCPKCGVYHSFGIAVGSPYGASCAFSFSMFQTWNHPGHVLRTPG